MGEHWLKSDERQLQTTDDVTDRDRSTHHAHTQVCMYMVFIIYTAGYMSYQPWL